MDELIQKYESILQNVIATPFEHDLWEATLLNLKNPSKLQFNNFAYALRELIRHILHRMAPDEQLEKCRWFVKVPDQSPTREARIKYCIHGGLSQSFLERKLQIKHIQTHVQQLIKTFQLLNKFTHITEGSFDLPEEEVKNLAKETFEALHGFIDKFNETRQLVIDTLAESLEEPIKSEIYLNGLSSLGEIAPAYNIDDVRIEELFIEHINALDILIKVQGQISCDQYYGKGEDATTISASHGFDSLVEVKLKQPLGSDIEILDLDADLAGWYGE